MYLSRIALTLSVIGTVLALGLAIVACFTEVSTESGFAACLFIMIFPLQYGTFNVLSERKKRRADMEGDWIHCLFWNLPNNWIRNYKVAFITIWGFGVTLVLFKEKGAFNQLFDAYMFAGTAFMHATAFVAYWTLMKERKFEQSSAGNAG